MNTFDWNAVGAIGEVSGAIAVAVTLLYVARQMRENAKGLKVQSLNETFRERSALMRELQDQAGMGDIVGRALRGGPLSEAERLSARIYLARVCALSDKLHYLHSIGAADDYNFESFQPHLALFVRTPFFAEWWSDSGERYSETFRRSVEATLAQMNETSTRTISDST